MTWLQGKKTYIVAGLMLLVGLVNGLTGAGWSGVIENLPIILNALGLGALRAGVSKSK